MNVQGVDIAVPELQMEKATVAAVQNHRDNGDFRNNAPYLYAAAESVDAKARNAYEILRSPVLVEDTALFLHGLRGEPGLFYSQVGTPEWNLEACIRVHEVQRKLNKPFSDYATAVVTLARWSGDPERPVDIWQGVLSGRVPTEPRGTNGFGWDEIFVPLSKEGHSAFFQRNTDNNETLFDMSGNYQGKTLAELTSEEKDSISMRAKALRKFCGSQSFSASEDAR
jgi:non-canonical purine NTP pyrophosphatase (RdgB/HAM1 family)